MSDLRVVVQRRVGLRHVTRRNPTGEFTADLDIARRLKRYTAREVDPTRLESLSTPHENSPVAA